MEVIPLQTALKYRCKLCRSFSIAPLAGGREFEHYPNLVALQNSANGGCDLCKLIWHCLTAFVPDDVVEPAMGMEHLQIMIRPNDPNGRIMPELGDHSAFNQLYFSCDKEENIGDWISGRAELFTLRNAPISNYFLNKPVWQDPSSHQNFEDIRGWMKLCLGHSSCEKLSERPLPKRLVDIRSFTKGSVNLGATEGKFGKYLALSYCWGLSPGLTTTVDSIDEHMKGIPISNLPATLADAIRVTHELGFQYIWIDALCILQARFPRDPIAYADWQEQSSKMADIYGNAYLTVAAANATDKNKGCFVHRQMTPHICELAFGNEHSTGGIYARPLYPPRFDFSKPILERRAWTFQEALLSQRLLTYGEREISFMCKTTTFFEKGPVASSYGGTLRTNVRGPQSFQTPLSKTELATSTKNIDLNSEYQESQSARDLRNHILDEWYRALETNFCGRLLTNEADMLPALSGVAHKIQPLIGGKYHAGLWECDLLRGLLWKPRNVISQRKFPRLTRPAVYRAPSWSWASLNGSIFYGYTADRFRNWEKAQESHPAKVLEVNIDHIGPSYDPMGGVAGGILKIDAPVRMAVIVPKSMNSVKTERLDFRGLLHRRSPTRWHLLVGNESVDKSDPEAVGALGELDAEENFPTTLWCLRLTLKEGILLAPPRGDSQAAKRIGFFELHRDDWFDGCENRRVIIE